MTSYDIDTIAIETRARALRASYIRNGLASLFARFRRAPVAGNATA